jgi:dUTP pyrophosphatase
MTSMKTDNDPTPAPDPPPPWEMIQQITEEVQNAYDNNELHPAQTTRAPCNSAAHLPTMREQSTNMEQYTHHTQTPTQQIIPQGDQIMVNGTIRLLKNGTMSLNIPNKPIRINVDGGANRSITNDNSILHQYKNIKRYAMHGISGEGPAVYCDGCGLLPWKAPTGEILMVKCYYSQAAAETIVSPTDVVITDLTNFNAWTQHSNLDTGQGFIEFHHRAGQNLKYPLYAMNSLWYSDTHPCTISDYNLNNHTPTIRQLTQGAMYELYHQRMGHPGERAMTTLHLHVDGIEPLKTNSFYKCASCLHAKMRQHPHSVTHTTGAKQNTTSAKTQDTTHTDSEQLQCGQKFHIDFGFMKGSGYSSTDEDGKTISSIDGYRAYCIIVDRKSRYTWVFLTKNKTPPIKLISTFLKEHGNKTATPRTIRTDQGGELWANQLFRDMIMEAGFLMEPTGAGAPFQNGLAERPNQTLGQMVRCLLHSSGLGPEYWSFAITHAIYLKNRLPHTAVNTTPYQAYTGKRPTLKYLRIFGCPVVIKNPGKRTTKLDLNTSAGRFLGFTATDRNIYYLDSQTRRIKIATHCVFDEAGMTLPPAEHTPAIKALQQAGWKTIEKPNNSLPRDFNEQPDSGEDHLQVEYLSSKAITPTRATDGSAGYDLFSPTTITIKPNQRVCVPTDIAILTPEGTYAHIVSNSGLVTKNRIDVKTGLIDSDCTGNVTVVLQNDGPTEYTIHSGDKIAQLIFVHTATPQVIQVQTLPHTTRKEQRLGSTNAKINQTQRHMTAANEEANGTPPQTDHTLTQDVDTFTQDVDTVPSIAPSENPVEDPLPRMPYDIYLSQDPFDKTLEVEIQVKGDHPSLGMQCIMCPHRNRLQIQDMAISTPASRIPKWRSTIRNTYLLKWMQNRH